MAKSLRSKAKRHFRLLRRDVVSNHPHVLAQEQARQAAMDAAVAAPTLPVPADKEDAGMDAEAGPGPAEAGGMDVDTREDLPECVWVARLRSVGWQATRNAGRSNWRSWVGGSLAW